MKKLSIFLIFGLVLTLSSGVHSGVQSAAEAPSAQQSFQHRWESLEAMEDELSKISSHVAETPLENQNDFMALSGLRDFQNSLVAAMVTDPVYNENRPEVSERAVMLTSELKKNFKALKKIRDTSRDLGISREVDMYLSTIELIIREREQRHYSAARAKLKELVLTGVFDRLMQVLSEDSLKKKKWSERYSTQASQQFLMTLANIQSTLLQIKDESYKQVSVFEHNQRVLSHNRSLSKAFEDKVFWVEKISGFVFVLTALTTGMGTFLLLQKSSKMLSPWVMLRKTKAQGSLKTLSAARISKSKVSQKAKSQNLTVVAWSLREHPSMD